MVFAAFLKRWLLTVVVVFGTYNPSGVSYFHWVIESDEVTSLHVFVGILLLCSAAAIGRMAFLSLGYFGLTATLLTLIFGVVLGAGLGLFELMDVEITTYTILFWTTLTLGVGVSWPFVQKHISGERDILRTPP